MPLIKVSDIAFGRLGALQVQAVQSAQPRLARSPARRSTR